MFEATKIIETIFNNRLREIAVKEHHPIPVKREFSPFQCLQHRGDLKDFGFKLPQKQWVGINAQSDGLGRCFGSREDNLLIHGSERQTKMTKTCKLYPKLKETDLMTDLSPNWVNL